MSHPLNQSMTWPEIAFLLALFSQPTPEQVPIQAIIGENRRGQATSSTIRFEWNRFRKRTTMSSNTSLGKKMSWIGHEIQNPNWSWLVARLVWFFDAFLSTAIVLKINCMSL